MVNMCNDSLNTTDSVTLDTQTQSLGQRKGKTTYDGETVRPWQVFYT